MHCDPREAMHEDALNRLPERYRSLTHRSDYAGLVTKAKVCHVKYARKSKTGKVHKVTGAYIRWDQAPFPMVTYSFKCSAQYEIITPVKEEDIPLVVQKRENCSHCFVVREGK
jgi:hypothetical protein